MLWESEHGHSDVRKYEVFGQKIQQLENLFGP